MFRRLFLLSVPIMLLAGIAQGQQSPIANRSPWGISGRVVDESTRQPMEYATVLLLSATDSTQAGGIATNVDGRFTIDLKQPGQYLLQVGFIGFESFQQTVALDRGLRHLELGDISLHPRSESLDVVTVTANEHAIEYQIDKKVVHVGEQYTAISGSAVDILENVPSIQVDIEGNVSLRGNSNFTVLIDDRPTVLDANDALQQIPAGMIKDIEIITNPSAKYDPEGTAGIINIITKKRTLEGMSGIAHLDVGLDDKYGADLLMNYRNRHFNFFVGGDYTDRSYPGFMEQETRTYRGDTTFFLLSDGSRRRGRESYSARAGVEWFPDGRNAFSVSGRYGNRGWKGFSNTAFEEWHSFSPGQTLYANDETSDRSGDYLSINSEYTHKFNGNKHKLDLQLMLYQREGSEKSVNTLFNTGQTIENSQKSLEGGPSRGLRYRVNYIQPFSEGFNIEAGAQGRLRDSDEWNEMYYYNTSSGTYDLQELFSHESVYGRSIHAGYALAKGELNNFGYQVGLRGEYTYRDIRLQGTAEPFNIDRWDLFPSLHFSYQLPNNHQVMASYSRRIDRPRGWYLEPFYTWSDAWNIRKGNPGLKPEYINSYELGYQKEFDKNSVSAEVYYRSTENRIERIRGIYPSDPGVILHTFGNIGTDYALGTELMANVNLSRWWESSLTGNFYNYRVEGRINDQDFNRRSFTWSLRWSHIFNITGNTRLQLNPSYHSPEIEAQEREEGFFYIHGAIRQSFMDNRLNLTLQLRDMFSTGKHESLIDEARLYSYRLYEHKAPMVMLNVTWRINNYRNGNQRNRGEMDMDMEGGGEM